ncbi:unnamed protein product [Phytophthora fragariaefolia]|uniref:Unnamed protein product n=1 Tax=Phytophthora fragariaefolia TaxID=1490495 RepID=A0A9W6Y632_9STRA|nr:unnamed protein product [Phytophthora fragariaefolia]
MHATIAFPLLGAVRYVAVTSRRVLAVDSFSRAPSTGVWYYRVDVSAYAEELVLTFIEEGDKCDNKCDDRRSRAQSPAHTGAEHYSVLRRYSDFLQLYEQIRAVVTATEGNTSSLPPFPSKEYTPLALLGLLWRVSPSISLLEERRSKFEMLLQWIENHPTARKCSAFVKFLGTPPQATSGYVSLKEYASPNWLSSLQQVREGVGGRKRRYSVGSSAIRSMLEKSISEAYEVVGPPRRQLLEVVRGSSTPRVLGKRRNRFNDCSQWVESPSKKMTRTTARIRGTQVWELRNAAQIPLSRQVYSERRVVQGKATPKRRISPHQSVKLGSA